MSLIDSKNFNEVMSFQKIKKTIVITRGEKEPLLTMRKLLNARKKKYWI